MTHADELMYLFPIPLMTDFNEEENHVAKMMTEMWTNFAIEGYGDVMETHQLDTQLDTQLVRREQMSEQRTLPRYGEGGTSTRAHVLYVPHPWLM